MLARHLYLKICVTVSAGLIVFAILATMLWSQLGHDQFNQQLFSKTSALTRLLLPAKTDSRESHQGAVDTLSRELDIEITVYDLHKSVLAASEQPHTYPDRSIEIGSWEPSDGGTIWATKLPDERVVLIELSRMSVPSEFAGIAVSLGSLALLISLIMYPFIRNLTSRLERLKEGVEKMGAGNLSARVRVEGSDEIAGLAGSFNQASDQIEQLVNSQRMLLANASHELRTPLSRIGLGVEMLCKGAENRHAVALRQDVQELDSLIDEIILITRLDTANDYSPTYQLVDFTALVAEECARYDDCVLNADHAEIKGDPRMLKHLVRNLLDNAYKHGSKPVTVTVENCHPNIRFTVADKGQGIAEQDRQFVLEPFYRSKDKQNVPGNGLGLALVDKITRAHNGSFSLGPVGTSSVVITLPR